MTIKVEEFTGAITIPEMTEETDMKGSIGMAVNENGDKFVVWMLTEMNMESLESNAMSTTVFVVDAVDATNTTQVTKEFDHPMMMTESKDKKYSHDKQQGNHENILSNSEQIENKIAKIEEKLSDRLKQYVPKELSRNDATRLYQTISKAIKIAENIIPLDQKLRKQYLYHLTKSPKSSHVKLLKKAKAGMLQQKVILELNKGNARKMNSLAARNNVEVAEMTKKIVSDYLKKR